MKTISCFGHRVISSDISFRVRNEVQKLLNDDPDTLFLLGHNGQFDGMVYHVLQSMEMQMPEIQYKIVLSYFPEQKKNNRYYPADRTCYPEGLELVHPKYAITMRNRWMVEQCDIVLCYITHSWGGAAQFVKKAEQKNKTVINIADLCR